MNHELRDAGQPCRKQLILRFGPEEVADAFEFSYREINGMVRLRGFRPGKAPRRTLEKKFAAEAASGAKQRCADKYLPGVLKDEKLRVIGPMEDKTGSAKPVPGQPYELTVEMDVEPDFLLPEYRGLVLENRTVSVAGERVDQYVEDLRREQAELRSHGNPAGAEDILLVDFRVQAGNDELKSMSDQRLRVGSDQLFGMPCPELADKFMGVRPGDVVRLSITLPEDHDNPDLRGKPAEVEVAVKEVEELVPPDSAALAARYGLESMDKLREQVSIRLANDDVSGAHAAREREIIDKLLAAVDYPAPPDMIRKDAESRLKEMRDALSASVADAAAREDLVEKMRPEVAAAALRRLRWRIMARRIAEKEDIRVEDRDLELHVRMLARSYGSTPDRILKRVQSLGGLEEMRDEILAMKVVQAVANEARGGRIYKAPFDSAGSLNVEAAASAAAASIPKAAAILDAAALAGGTAAPAVPDPAPSAEAAAVVSEEAAVSASPAVPDPAPSAEAEAAAVPGEG